MQEIERHLPTQVVPPTLELCENGLVRMAPEGWVRLILYRSPFSGERNELVAPVGTSLRELLEDAVGRPLDPERDTLNIVIGDRTVLFDEVASYKPTSGECVIARIVPGISGTALLITSLVLTTVSLALSVAGMVTGNPILGYIGMGVGVLAIAAGGLAGLSSVGGSALGAGSATVSGLNVVAETSILASVTVGQAAGMIALGGGIAQGIVGMVGALTQGQAGIPSQKGVENSAYLKGTGNRSAQWEPIPSVFGRALFAPPLGGQQIGEVAADGRMWVRATFVAGYGPVEIKAEDIKIGETLLSNYELGTYELEIREGFQDDTDLTLYPSGVSTQEVAAVLVKGESTYGSLRDFEADSPTLTGRIYDAAPAGAVTINLGFNDDRALGANQREGEPGYQEYGSSFFKGWDNLILGFDARYAPGTVGKVKDDIANGTVSTIRVKNPGGAGYTQGEEVTIRTGTRKKQGFQYYWHSTTIASISGDYLTLTDSLENPVYTKANVAAVYSDFAWTPPELERIIEDGDIICVQLDDYSWQEVTVQAGGVGALSTEHFANINVQGGGSAFTAVPYRTITFAPPLERPALEKAGVIRFGVAWETRTTAKETVEATIELHNPSGIVSYDDSGDRWRRRNELCVWIRSSDPGGSNSPGPGRWECASAAGDGAGSATPYTVDTDERAWRTSSHNWGVVPGMSKYNKHAIDWNAVNGTIDAPTRKGTGAGHYCVFGLASRKVILWEGERFRGTFASFTIDSLDEGQYDIRIGVTNVTWNQKNGHGDANWTGLQSKKRGPTSQTAVKMAQVAIKLKSTGERSGTIGDLQVLANRMLPFYEKNPAVSNGGDWIEPPSRTARTQVKTSINASTTLVCDLSEKVELSGDASRGDITIGLDRVGMLREGDEVSFSTAGSGVVYSENFTSTNGGWLNANCTHSSQSGALHVVASGSDPYHMTNFIQRDLGRTIRGSDFTQIKVWIKKGSITGSGYWVGQLRWKSSVDNQYFGYSEYFNGPQLLAVAEPTWTGGYVEVTWDMANAPYDVRPGGTPRSTWLDREIQDIRFDFFQNTDSGNYWDIDKIEISGDPKYTVRKVDSVASEIILARKLYTDVPGTAYCGTWLKDQTGATSAAGDRGARQIGRDPNDDAVTMPHYITAGTTSAEPDIDLPFRNDSHSFANHDTITLESDHLHVAMNLAGSASAYYPQIWANDGASTFPSVQSRNMTHASFSVRCPRPMDSPGGGYFSLWHGFSNDYAYATNFNSSYLISGSTDDINDTTFTTLTFYLSPAVGNSVNWGVGNLSTIVIRPIVLTDGADWETWGWFDVKDFTMWKASAPAKVLSSVFTANTATYTLKDPITVTAGDAVAIDYEKFLTRSPAWACAEVLRGNAQPRMVGDSFLDSDSIADWHAYCLDPAGDGSQPQLQFDTLVDFRGTTLELINRISGSARGSLRSSDGRIGFLWDFDRSAETPVAMFTPRNSIKFSYKSAFSYVDLPHAWRVRYNDKEGKAGEHLVFRDGYNKYGSSGATKATRYEVLQTWGITNPDAVFQYAKYVLANATHRREVVAIGVDIEHALVERGDLVILAHDTDFSGVSFGRISMLNSGDVRDFSVSGAITRSTANATAGRYSVDVLDGGKTICLTENSWTYDTRLITVPANALIQFDYRAENYLPEIAGIGYSASLSSGMSVYQLSGTQASGNQTYRSMYDGASGISVATINNSGGYAAGDTVIEVDSTTGFVVGDPVVIEPVTGATGGQYWESTLSAVGPTSLTLSSAIGSGITVDDGTSVTTTKVRTGEWVSYEIPFPEGDYYIGFAHDHDVNAEGDAKSYFRNVRVTSTTGSIELDEPITLTEGETGYKAKIRQAGTQSFVEYDLTNTNTTGLPGNEKQTETMTFATPPSLETGPDVGDMVVFGQGQVVPRRMLVEAVTPTSDLGAGIQLVSEGEGIWTELASSATTIPAADPIQNYFSHTMLPKKPRIDSVSIKENQSGVMELAVSVSPSHHDTVPIGHFEIEWQLADNDGWSGGESHIAMASTGPREVRFQLAESVWAEEKGAYPRPIQVRARSHRQGATHYHSDWEKTETLLVSDLRSAGLIDYVVLSLELSGSGNNFEFFSSSPKIDWKIGEIPEVHNQLLYGDHGDINTDWWSRGGNANHPEGIPGVSVPCEVVVSYAPAGVASKVLRVENIAEASYVYSLDKNLADGGPYRDLEFKVTPVTGVERGSSQSIFVTNPAHPLPQVRSIAQDTISLIFDFDDNFRQGADLENLIIWASATEGFTPGGENEIYSGRFSRRLRIPALPPLKWYFRWSVTDHFYRDAEGTDPLILSEEKSVQLVPSSRYEDIIIGELGNIWPDPVFNYLGDYANEISLEQVVNPYNAGHSGFFLTGTIPLGPAKGWEVRVAESSPTISPRGGKYMVCFDATGYDDHSHNRAILGGFGLECPKFEGSHTGGVWSATDVHSPQGLDKKEHQFHPASPGDVFTFSCFGNRSANSDHDRAGLEHPIITTGVYPETGYEDPGESTNRTDYYVSLEMRFWDKDKSIIDDPPFLSWHPEEENMNFKADFPANTWTEFSTAATAPPDAAFVSGILTLGTAFVRTLFGSQDGGYTFPITNVAGGLGGTAGTSPYAVGWGDVLGTSTGHGYVYETLAGSVLKATHRSVDYFPSLYPDGFPAGEPPVAGQYIWGIQSPTKYGTIGTVTGSSDSDPGQIYFDSFDFRRASEAKHLAASAVTTAKLAANAVTTRAQDISSNAWVSIWGICNTPDSGDLMRAVADVVVDGGAAGGIAKVGWTGTSQRIAANTGSYTSGRPWFKIDEVGAETTTTTGYATDVSRANKNVAVDDASGFSVGDMIGIDVDIAGLENHGLPYWIFREIGSIAGNTITLTTGYYWGIPSAAPVYQILATLLPPSPGLTFEGTNIPQVFDFHVTQNTVRTGIRKFRFIHGNDGTFYLQSSQVNEGATATVEIVKK